MTTPLQPRDARTESPVTDRPGCRRRMRGAREAAFIENGGKRWLRVAAGLLWAPNNNEVPAGGNEIRAWNSDVPAGNNEVPAGNNEVPAGNNKVPVGHNEVPVRDNEVPVGTGGNERNV